MIRFAPGIFGLALFALWVWAVLDVIATDRVLVRNFDKTMWLLLVIFIPTVGAIAWIGFGRPVNAGFAPGSTEIRQSRTDRPRRPIGPEDRDEWTGPVRSTPSEPRESDAARERRLLEWEAELAKRESELDEGEPSD